MTDWDQEIIVGVGIVLSVIGLWFWREYGDDVMRWHDFLAGLPWKLIGITLLCSVVLLFMTWKTITSIKRYKSKQRWRDYQYQCRRNEILELLGETYADCRPDQVMERFEEIEDKLRKYSDEDLEEFKERLKHLEKRARAIKHQKEKEEERERQKQQEIHAQEEYARMLEEQEKQKKRDAFEKQVNKLLEFMKKRGSDDALPLKHDYDESVCLQAQWRMRRYMEDQDKRKGEQKKAVEFYKTHPIDSQPMLKENWKKEEWAKIRSNIEKGVLRVDKISSKDYKGPSLEKVFLRARKMTREEKLRAKLHNYEFVRGSELNSHLSGGFYIKRPDSSETQFHFITKHLIAELHQNMQLEYYIRGKRADVALTIDAFRLAIEVETGKNKLKQIEDKLYWLNKHFHQWIIVCKKEYIPRYTQFVDNKKSYVFTPKEAKEYIEKICYYH